MFVVHYLFKSPLRSNTYYCSAHVSVSGSSDIKFQTWKSTNNFIMLTNFIILLCMFVPSNAVKESVVQGSENNDAKLILDLIKRLGEPSYNYQEESAADGEAANLPTSGSGKQSQSASSELRNLQTCEPVIQQGSIIKTKESISAGAAYVDSVKNVKSNADCLEYCCQNWTCDVAVYQDKGEKYCYLFHCDGRCIFKAHSDYFVSTIKSRKTSEQPEEDLQNLNAQGTGIESDQTKLTQGVMKKPQDKQEITPAPSGHTTAGVAVTTETEAPELVITPHSVGLLGFCTQDRHCEDPNAVCGHGNCVCSNSYYNKDGICRKVCLKSEFECFDLGTLSRGPECISQSQVCDSYLHCADGSDEFNCQNIDFPTQIRPLKSSNVHTNSGSQQPLNGHKKSAAAVVAHEESTQAAKPTPHPTIPAAAATSGNAKASTPTTKSPPPHKSAPEARPEKKHIFMSSEKVIIANASDAEGPIIALSLGLAFTVILLVLVGCRLRNVRHRLRKGRPLHQNEADYLINGMYL
ncbi:unnamed protein product [Candidula unifasciata]|uniref:MANSC domain-containing protein n=1 Tax=Candidula unifasciata TaxID=100452 RepID=A0A8S3YW56_9EUPU|nr:unnamed protein product [Candidula unifasciata]